ncbi:MAG TPA: heavy metal-responsive transcriptional regulator, partial [Pyrinomonadaceae bacterium]|nr:heavy metal-responsive transcriptional regulator [Pyrinomonadaceae bacterium]
MRAGSLAREASVSTDTLRHYERKGVLPRPRRSPNGYREYPPEALARVLLVRRALAFGFTLDELARVLRARDRGAAPCKEVRALAAAKLAGVEARLEELTVLRDELRATLDAWDSRLSKTT